MMRNLGPAGRAVVGLVATVVIGTVGFFGTRLAQGAFAEDYRIYVTVGETGQGIISGSDVTARGVIVGEVGTIELDEDLQAVVELILEPHHTVPRDAIFAITGKTLLGEKQVEILFDGPFGAEDALAEGDLVDDPDQVVELQDVLQDLDELLGAIDPVDLAVLVDDGLGAYVGQEAAIARAIDQGARATDVFSRSLDDQVPTLRDLSLVAEALGRAGDEFNRMGGVVDLGALDTITDNQDRLVVLLDELVRFSDQLDLVLELTRPDLDRMLVEGDNVTRLLFAYRPELADLLVGINDYSDTIGNGGLTDPGFTGFAAGFQIMMENPLGEVCHEVPPGLVDLLPGCAGHGGEPEDGEGPGAPPGTPEIPLPELPLPDLPLPEPAPDSPLPDLPLPEVPLTARPGAPLLEIPATIPAQPEAPAGGLETILDGLLSTGALAGGGAS